MSTRVFVRLYDGTTQYETDDEVLELPLPPLKWKDAITAMVAAVGKQDEYEDGVTIPKARLFLLPTEAAGIAAELNARSLRFGVRENDRFVVCLQGEDYQQSSERQLSAEAKVAAAFGGSSNTGDTNNVAPTGKMGIPPRGGLKGGTLSGSLTTSSKKGSKRYRSISGKMAAIKSLSDMGVISNSDRGHLKDLLLNSDSPRLQEALDEYNNTGNFQAVKDLLLNDIQNPPLKRNTTDWLSESFVNDIALNISTPSHVAKMEPVVARQTNNIGRFNPVLPTTMTLPANTYKYPTTSQATPMSLAGYLEASSVAINHSSTFESLVTPADGNLSTSNGYTAGIIVSNINQPMTVIPEMYCQPQASSTNNMYRSAPNINLPLRDRATYMKRGYESSPANNLNMLSTSPAVSLAMSPQMGMNGYMMQQGYLSNQGSYPANIIYAGDQYSMNPYVAGANGLYNQYQQQPQYAINRYGYGSMQPDVGYNLYASDYGSGKVSFHASPGGKWTAAPPMPSYPPPCSKEEKKDKIAKWLKKRENRNWSNKPSYPVRHSIAKNRKRGEDGRFITKARLAEMAAQEALAAAVVKNNNESPKVSLPSPTSEEASILIVSQTGIPQATFGP
ncbi:unnamed protein product [Peronospora belbahrii]|uniref:CCT domain-containing protein n=1 Tax=Peronospora belbahrii TaxID=622444 RepID=A0ABN8D6J4_9STRA|nr:unnamed protein product [Peronospora belbahrii]